MNSSNTIISILKIFLHNIFQVFSSSSCVVAMQGSPYLVFAKFPDEEKCRTQVEMTFLTDRSVSFAVVFNFLCAAKRNFFI